MKHLLHSMWLHFCNLTKINEPIQRTTLRDKAIAVAKRVSVVKEGDMWKVSCPVCFDVIRLSHDSDLRMALAVHLSLWHPNEVKLQWEMMQDKGSAIHVPSFFLGAGIIIGFGTLLAFVRKRQGQNIM